MQRLRPHLVVILVLLFAGCVSAPADYEEQRAAWDRRHAAERADLPAEAEELGDATDLASLLRYARRHNPGLEAAFQRWKAALERVPQVTKLPEPRLGFAVYLSEVETRVGPMRGRVGLSQAFPWFGKLEEAGDVAFQEAEVARESLEEVRLELDQKVRDTWYEYAWLEQAILITKGHRELLAHWESVARARMETALGAHSDVIRAQVELGKLEDRLQTLADLRRPLVARLNAALNRPLDAPVPPPAFPLPDPPAFDETRLAQDLMVSSPVLRALEHRIAAARHGIELARKEFYPDFALGFEYAVVDSARASGVSGSGDDVFAPTLGLELPIRRSAYRAGLREAEARMIEARRQQEEVRNAIASDLEMALYEFRDAHRRVGLFRDSLIPKGEESVQALDTAYQAGNEGFLDLIDAERVLLEFQLQAVRAEADRAQALAKTERITGIELFPEQ